MNQNPHPDDPLLSAADAAKLLGVCGQSIRTWSIHGLIPFVRTAGGHRRYRRSDVETAIEGAQERRERERSRHVTTYLPPALHEAVQKLAEGVEGGVSAVVREAVTKYVGGL